MTDPANLVSEFSGAMNEFIDWRHGNPTATRDQFLHELYEKIEYLFPILKNTEGNSVYDEPFPQEPEE